ncbi:hypothetical protein, partial [Roseibacillus persicicus]|uniref:hypothetical protein n=1 Tax=Roseibacillus persicicus TaxID=454148 RepID=UPI001E65529A
RSAKKYSMWKTATLLSVAGVIVAIVVTELVRGVVDRYRTKTQGMGGSQDVLLVGTVIGWTFVAMTIGFGLKWWMTANE